MHKLKFDDTSENDKHNLVNCVLSVMRYLGHGSIFNLRSQVFSRISDYCSNESMLHKNYMWEIYNRLCDFGLISEHGAYVKRTWKWSGENFILTNDNSIMFPEFLSTFGEFNEVKKLGDFIDVSVCMIKGYKENNLHLKYSKAEYNATLQETILHCNSSIRINSSRSLLSLGPTMQEVFEHLASPTTVWPDNDELELQKCSESNWFSYTGQNLLEPFLLRKRRKYSVGFQYWLYIPKGNSLYEMPDSDWLSVLLWWVGGKEWSIFANIREKTITFPVRLFYFLPQFTRQLLIQRSMVWPNKKNILDDNHFIFKEISDLEIEYFERCYAPAIRVFYE